MEKMLKIDKKSYVITSDDDYLHAIGEDFEPHMVKLFKALIKSDDIVADVGANIGLTAILFSNLAKKVYSFEPSPSTYQLLKKNLASSQIYNVEPINIGLGVKKEKLTITFAENNRSGGFVSDKIQPKKGHITEVIQIDSLDNFSASNGIFPNFIKIDVEGFEGNVIQGASEVLKESKPIVALEMNHFCLNALRRITLPDFLDDLRAAFPYLYAVDVDNTSILNLHDEAQAYAVMYAHLTSFRYPNLVGGFDTKLEASLKDLEKSAIAESKNSVEMLITPEVSDVTGSVSIADTSTVPAMANCGESFYLKVDVHNQSKCVWCVSGSRPVRLSYHWEDARGVSIQFDGDRSALSEDLEPNQVASAVMNVRAPSTKGTFKLIVTLVQENVCWFESRGFVPAELSIVVI